MNKTKTDYSLLVLLLFATCVFVFPYLGDMQLRSDEAAILDLAHRFSSSGISSVFEGNGADYSMNFYSYLVSIILNNIPVSEAFAVRLPSAVVMQLLALGMYVFRGNDEKMSKAFLASLLFLSGYTVASLASHANVVCLMALAFICSLSAMYHWIKFPTGTKAYIAVVATACTSIFMGIAAPAAILAVSFIFLGICGHKRAGAYIKIAFMIIVAVALAYLSLIFITNDSFSAQNILQLQPLTQGIGNFGKLSSFLGHLFFSIFPWSIPIAVAIFWVILHPQWFRDRFRALTLLKQFGVIVFLLAIPSFAVLNRLSVIMLVAVIFFNMPVVSSFILSQLHFHSITWKITGLIFASIIAMVAAAFVAVLSGVVVLPGVSLPGWSFGNIAILVAIVVCLYHLWRNRRTIAFSNIYFYNIVILYILAQLLYKGYINPYIGGLMQ